MRTIFITIFEGVEVKNILRTPILENLLKEDDIRIVLFTKSVEKLDFYKKEFNDPRILFEVVEWKSKSFVDNLFAKLKFVLLRTKTTDLKRKLVCQYEKKYLRYLSGRLINMIFAWPIFRKIARFIDFALVKDDTFKTFFDKYNPDLVFMAHLFDEPEIAMLREAKKRNIKTVGFINSWDKVTARCMLRLLPNKLIVFNNIVKKELIDFNEVMEEDVFVSGLPQYDFLYSNKVSSREDFFKKINIDPQKELLVYASMGRAFSVSDWDMIDFLYSLKFSGKLKKDFDVLVRFQPNDFVDEEELKKRPNLKYDLPGKRFGSKRGVDWDMNFGELNHLHDTLFHMSILVCYASSISIDAVVLDRPVVNIDFEIKENPFLLKSPTQYYKTVHYKNAVDIGAISLVKSKEQLVESLNSYLLNPSLLKSERARLVREQCVFTDGKSGERVAKFLLQNIKS
ncbi:MAG: hypothetical protein QG585_227 [Patescibacteria group bacterium]|jgi:hypothetical protein|nr:hypothetical protein [Patescibacteria group bacterium]